MTQVVLSANLPSVRLGLASMLAEYHHEPVAEDEAGERAVWVLDAPTQQQLDQLVALRYSDQPRAAVVLTDDPSIAGQLARAGLRGWACIGREAAAEDLDLAVRTADGGLVLMDHPTAASVIPTASLPGARTTSDTLTPREVQVLQLIAQGMPNKGIGRALGISENTAKFHVASLTAKLGASGRTEAVTLAARQGLILL